MMKFADIILHKGERQKKICLNDVLDSMAYLCRVGILSYTEQFTDHGMRFFFKRSSDDDKIRSILGSPPPAPAKPNSAVKPESAPEEKGEGAKSKSTKKKKKKKKNQEKTEAPKPKKKKKKKCCGDPRPVRSKKTGKRRCKNCGTKLPDKKV